MVKKCLVLGSANCLFDDVDRALDMAEFDGVVACKGAGLAWTGTLEAWVSLHPARLPDDIAERRRLGYPDAGRTYGHCPTSGVSHDLPYLFDNCKTSGSSGLFAVKVAMEEFGYDRLVLCGIPMQREYGRLDNKQMWAGSRLFMRGWEEAMPHIKNSVRSMSGWTKALLGEPTPRWLDN
jgi:hypothetical protein